jgi:hypothetical protein
MLRMGESLEAPSAADTSNSHHVTFPRYSVPIRHDPNMIPKMINSSKQMDRQTKMKTSEKLTKSV